MKKTAQVKDFKIFFLPSRLELLPIEVKFIPGVDYEIDEIKVDYVYLFNAGHNGVTSFRFDVDKILTPTTPPSPNPQNLK